MTEPNGGLRQTVLVFTSVMLPYSQTFIRDHVTYLKRYNVVLAAFKETQGLPLGEVHTALVATNPLARWCLYWLGRSRSLDRLVGSSGARIVHCHFADVGALLTRYCQRRGLPLIVTIHGSDVLRRRPVTLSRRFKERLFQEGLRGATRYLPVSNWLMSRSQDAGVPPSLMQLHYLGIPLDPVRQDKGSAGVPVILFVGRLVAKKGLMYLLDAVRILVERGEQFQVRIVGGGPLREIAETMVQDHALPVSFAGVITPEQVRTEMDNADIFCMPSTAAVDGDNEGLGLVFVEAQSRLLPVVSFNQGPIPEAVNNGVSGLLVEDKNTEALVKAIATLIRDPAARQCMGRRGRELAETRFDICEQTRKLETIYDDVLSSDKR